MTRSDRLVVALRSAEVVDDRWRRVAELRSLDFGTRDLWYEVDAARAPLTNDRADPFVVATLILAMSAGHDLEITGAAVDHQLLRNLAEFQRIWSSWWDYRPVAIHADAATVAPSAAARVVAFSGGADSAFSAWWHTRGDGGDDPPLGAGMMLRGIDIPIEDPAGFERAAARARQMSDSLDLELLTVTTNAWSLPVPEGHYTGMGIAAALHVFGGGFGGGLIPSTATYRDLVVPLNSSPVSDWLLGGRGFTIVHDAARYNRFEKLQRLAEWPEAMASLRVCLLDPRHDRNCGTCNKCMMTLAAFRIIGVNPSCFEEIPSADELRRWAATLPSNDYYLQEGTFLVEAAQERGLHEPWVDALRSRIRTARVKDAVRAAFPGFADGVASVHRRANNVRRAVATRTRPR